MGRRAQARRAPKCRNNGRFLQLTCRVCAHSVGGPSQGAPTMRIECWALEVVGAPRGTPDAPRRRGHAPVEAQQW